MTEQPAHVPDRRKRALHGTAACIPLTIAGYEREKGTVAIITGT